MRFGGSLIFLNTDNEKPKALDELKEALKESGIDYNAIIKTQSKDGSNAMSCGGVYHIILEPPIIVCRGLIGIYSNAKFIK